MGKTLLGFNLPLNMLFEFGEIFLVLVEVESVYLQSNSLILFQIETFVDLSESTRSQEFQSLEPLIDKRPTLLRILAALLFFREP